MGRGDGAIDTVRDRLLGCIVAGAIGDALGGPFEGPESVPCDAAEQLRVSDDTQLTLATCEAIGPGGVVTPSDVAARFVAWFRQGRIHGVGASTLQALRALDAGAHWASAGRVGERAAGNGAAMRIAPLAFCVDPSSADGRTLLRDICCITHRHDEAYVGALAILEAVRLAAAGEWPAGEGLAARVAATLPDTRVRDALFVADRLPVEASTRIAASVVGSSGHVVESVPLAIFAAQRASVVGLPAVLDEINETGGDTDTIASMAGQIAGARTGYAGIPEGLCDRVLGINQVIDTARSLADRLCGPDL